MGSALRAKIIKKSNESTDFKEIRNNIHFIVLLGVSIVVFMDMEKRLSVFRAQIQSSMSEREYDHTRNYNDIIDQIKDYDGVGVAMDRPDDKLPTYKYELGDKDD